MASPDNRPEPHPIAETVIAVAALACLWQRTLPDAR